MWRVRSLLIVIFLLTAVLNIFAEDPDAGKATYNEIESIKVEFDRLSTFDINSRGQLIACELKKKQILIIDQSSKILRKIDLDFTPEAIAMAGDDNFYCGGEGRIVLMDLSGKILRSAGDLSELFKDSLQDSSRMKRRKRTRNPRISGLAVGEKDIFMTIGTGWSRGSKSKLYRLDKDLKESKLLDEGLRGCCQRCDIIYKDGVLYMAENAVHRIVKYNRDGKVVGKWGERSRTSLEGFGSCCNPMNLYFGKDGYLYTAESGLGRVKKYSIDGKFLELVGYIGVERFTRAGGLAAACSNIAIAITQDGKKIFVMDYKENMIRVLARK